MPESELLVLRVVAWLLRMFNLLLRGGLSLGALVLVVLALYVSLGRELMPLLAEYRADVEREVQTAIGLPLHIGRLEGSWRDFSPLLVAHDVELGEGADRVYLQTLRLKLDPLQTLLGRRLEIKRLELDGLRLSVVQSAQGGWSVAGLPASSNASAAATPEEALGALLGISQLLLLNSQITIQPFDGMPISFTYVELELRNGLRQRLDGHLNLPDGLPVSFSLRGTLNPADWRNSAAKLYVNVPQSDWSTRLPPALLPGWTLDRLTAGGEFWAAVEDGQIQHLVARLNALEIKAAAAGRKAVEMQDLAVTAYLDGHPDGFDLRLESLALSLDQTRFGPVQLQVQRRQPAAASAPTWQVQADRLDLAPLATLAASLAPAEPVVDEWLAGLKPHGQVRNIQVTFDEQKTTPDRLQFAANLTALGISAYSDVPGLENVTGLISGDLGQGALRLNTENFVLNLAAVFPAPWHYFKAGALLAWTLDDQVFSLYSPYFRLEGDEGRIAGDMQIAIPFAADEYSYMDLRVGLTEGDAAYVSKYLPLPSEDFSVELADWLKTAIVSGDIDEGLFQYQGTLSTAAPEISSTLSLYFKLHALELAYQPGWPALREAAGEVFVDSNGVKANVSYGKVLDSTLSQVHASVLPTANDQIPHLKLTADLESSVKDGLTILQTAPLEADYTFDGWSGEGALAGKLSLDIPLEGSAEPQVVVDFAANGARLSIPEPPLQVTQISAALRYNSASGLSAPSIRARVFNQAVTGKIYAEGARGITRTRIEASSKVALKDLTGLLGISGQQVPAAGSIPFKLNLILDDKSQLQIDSSLQGLSIDLPAPFGKLADEERATEFRMLLDDKQPVYWAKYAELASLALALPNGMLKAVRAELVLGGQTATLPAETGLWVRGQLAELDVDAWKALAERYSGQVPGQGQGASFNKALLRSLSLQIGRFQGFGLDVDNLGITLLREDTAWQIGINSSKVDGSATIPDQSGQPLVLDFKRVSLPEPPTSNAEAMAKLDPLADIDPSSLPALDVKIDQILLGSAALGASSFKLRPVVGGVELSELNLNFKGLQVTGNAGWSGRPGATESWYKGRMLGQDLGAVLQAWNFAPTVTSERFRVDADLRWPGSPAFVNLARLSGTMDSSMHNGRFTEVNRGGTNAARVFGLANLSAIGRRLRLDFSDLFGKGIAYDRVRVLLVATNGVFVTRNPLEVQGPGVQLELNGTMDMAAQTINAQLFVTVPVSNAVVLGVLAAGAPVVAGALYAADNLSRSLFGVSSSDLTRVRYQVNGPIENPTITFFKQRSCRCWLFCR